MQSIIQYNNGNLIITDTKELMITEVENLLSNSRNILDNIDYHKNILVEGEEVLKILNPQFAKDKARDEEISSLKEKVGGMENKIDTIINLLQKPENNKTE